MKAIKRLTLQNFQGHRKTTIDFDEHVNIIIGDTDSGKTSIFRALYKALREKPSGVDFVSTWADECIITIEGYDGTIVERVIKTRSTKQGEKKLADHYYRLIRPNQQPEIYTGFNKTLPEDIQNVFNMLELDLGKESIDFNFADQHDPYFLIGKKDGLTRLKLLSKISHADVFEDVRADIKTQERSSKTMLTTKEKELEQATIAVEAFSKFVELKPSLSKLKKDILELSNMKLHLSLMTKYMEVTNALKKYSVLDDSIKPLIYSVETEIETFKSSEKLKGDLLSLYLKYQNVTNSLRKIPDMSQTGGCITTVEESIDELINRSKQLIDIQNLHKKLQSINTNLQITNSSIIATEDEITNKVEAYKKKVFESGVCPFCLKEISDEDIEHVMKSIMEGI